MVRLLALLLTVAGLGTFACCVIILIKQFQAKAFVWAILNILTIGLLGLIWGWMNLNKHNLRKVMFAWATFFLLQVSLIAFFVMTGRIHLITGQPQ